ncbi:hypothetical protein RJI07_00420 [Mycoplasmatota bacterium WC30]
MKKLYNVLGQLFGFFTILMFAFLHLNTVFDFGIDASIISILLTIKEYAVYVVCGLAGLELVAGKKLFAFVYFIILALVVVFSFFPEVAEQITNVVT